MLFISFTKSAANYQGEVPLSMPVRGGLDYFNCCGNSYSTNGWQHDIDCSSGLNKRRLYQLSSHIQPFCFLIVGRTHEAPVLVHFHDVGMYPEHGSSLQGAAVKHSVLFLWRPYAMGTAVLLGSCSWYYQGDQKGSHKTLDRWRDG